SGGQRQVGRKSKAPLRRTSAFRLSTRGMPMRRRPIAWFLALLTSLMCAARPSRASAQTDTTAARMPPPGAPVTFGNDTLFFVKAFIGPYSPERRAAETTDRIRRIIAQQ